METTQRLQVAAQEKEGRVIIRCEWLAHAAPIMVCVAGCGIGKATHNWIHGLCSDCWLAARRA